MELQPSATTYFNVLTDRENPPQIRAQEPFELRRQKRRYLQQWYTRRRQMMESQYFNWLRAHAHDGRTRPWTLEFMSRWMIERAASAEEDASRRNRRRAELSRKWRRFSRQARNLSAPERK